MVAVVFPLDFAWYALMMFSGLPIYPLVTWLLRARPSLLSHGWTAVSRDKGP